MDASFGSGGVVRIPLSGYSSPRAVSLVLQPDGKIVVAGLAGWVVPGTGGGKTYTYPWVARCSASGSLDASFGKDGVTVDARRPYVWTMGGVVHQSGGRILVTHSVGDEPIGPYDYVVTGYTSAGKLDASFGPVTWPTESSVGIAVDASDRVLVTTNTGGSNPSMVRVRRYLSAGVLDSSFGSAGLATFGVYVNQRAYTNPVLDAQGRILFGIAGAGTYPGATFQAAAVRLLDDGSPDPSFGGNGLGQPLDLGPGASAWGHTLDVAPDGSVLLADVGSTSATAWFTVRYAPE
jgi:uncharacterized delta-60 repeat protein